MPASEELILQVTRLAGERAGEPVCTECLRGVLQFLPSTQSFRTLLFVARLLPQDRHLLGCQQLELQQV